MYIGCILRKQWSPWVVLSVVDSGGPQRPYWPVPSDWPYGQHCQVKNDDMSSRGDMVGNLGGGGCTLNYGEVDTYPERL